jgi:O-acetyl-ADP-ribose deacetylase (regulator of RNase III)
MIHEVTGDILLSKAQVIAHGVAPNDPFANGLAHALRERWPAMYKDFRHYCHTAHPQPGEIWAWAGPGIRVVSLMTQDAAYGHGAKPGRAGTQHVNHSLRKLRKFLDDEKVASLALPRIATGNGGLDWAHVKPLIQSHLGDAKIPVYVYTTYKAGVEADEAGAARR